MKFNELYKEIISESLDKFIKKNLDKINKTLKDSIIKGNLKELQNYQEKNPKEFEKNIVLLFQVAASLGDIKILDYLNNLNLDVSNMLGLIFIDAVHSNQINSMKFLMDKMGYKIKNIGPNLVYYASSHNFTEIVKFLINNNALDFNKEDFLGTTITSVFEFNNLDLFKFLIKNGAIIPNTLKTRILNSNKSKFKKLVE